jgi:hypothetical protein
MLHFVRTLKKLNVLIIILLLVGVGRSVGVADAIVIRAPRILSVSHSPLEPPPGYPVNVTALVSGPRPIDKVTLDYSSSIGMNGTIGMVFVEGNDTFAFFFATLPANADGTTVNYRVVAFDSSGFHGESDAASFTVRPDRAPPEYDSWYTKPHGFGRDFPITEWWETDVIYNITDSGSGVKGVTLKYTNSSDPKASLSMKSEMHLSEGDRYNGIWIGVVPPMKNGTRVRYLAESHDFSGNAVSSTDSEYHVVPQHSPYSTIQVSFEDIDLVTRTATVRIFVGTNLPSRYPPPLLNSWIETGIDIEYFQIPRISGFWYQGSLTWRTHFYGETTLYPFDSYWLPVNITIYSWGLNGSNSPVELYSGYNVTKSFDPSMWNHTEVLQPGEQLHVSTFFWLNRKASLIDPVMQSIYAVFFVLGSTAWIPLRRRYLASRLGMYVGLFTFVIVLLFTATPILEGAGISGASVPLVLLMSLPWSIGIFMLGTLLFLFLEETGRLWHKRLEEKLDRFLSFVLPTIAVLIVIRFGQLLAITWGVFGIHQASVPILLGLFYAAVGRVVLEVLPTRVGNVRAWFLRNWKTPS